MKILYINPLLPYPVLQGNQRTAINRFKELSKRHEITLIAFYHDKHDLANRIEQSKEYCKEVIPIYLPKWKAYWNIISRFAFSKLPLQVLYYYSKELENIVSKFDKNNFDIIHVNTLRTEVYFNDKPELPLLIDLHDSMILNIKRRLDKETGIAKLIYKIEHDRVKKYEENIVKQYPHIMVLAEQDKEILGNEKISVIPIGVDTDSFKNDKILSNSKTLIFSGNMSYTPNVDAIEWFILNCWEDVKKTVPSAKLVIAGTNPSNRLIPYKQDSSINITGKVESIVDEINKAQIAITPMQIGSGMQNKVLEAMACGLPVITTTLGLGSIEANNNKNIIVADTPAEFTKQCIELLLNYDRAKQIGLLGLDFVVTNNSISSHALKMEKLYNSINQTTNSNYVVQK
jgi:glycosyltransferase involved in cell wall biosynthesis